MRDTGFHYRVFDALLEFLKGFEPIFVRRPKVFREDVPSSAEIEGDFITGCIVYGLHQVAVRFEGRVCCAGYIGTFIKACVGRCHGAFRRVFSITDYTGD